MSIVHLSLLVGLGALVVGCNGKVYTSTASAGQMSCDRFFSGSSKNGVKVSGGIHEKYVSRSRMMIIPSQNEGTASPAIEITRTQ